MVMFHWMVPGGKSLPSILRLRPKLKLRAQVKKAVHCRVRFGYLRISRKRVLVAKFFFNYPKMKMAWMCVWQIRGDHFIIYPLPRTEGADIGFCWIINLIFYWFYRYGDHAIQERGNINVFVVPHKCITLKRKSLTLCCRVHRHLDRSWCTRSEQWCYENAQFSRSEIIWLLTIKKFIHQNTSW